MHYPFPLRLIWRMSWIVKILVILTGFLI